MHASIKRWNGNPTAHRADQATLRAGRSNHADTSASGFAALGTMTAARFDENVLYLDQGAEAIVDPLLLARGPAWLRNVALVNGKISAAG